jgi:hypothetical protein
MAKFTPKPFHDPTPPVPAAGEVLKIVHYKDLLKCNHGGTVNLDPTEERKVEIMEDLRVVTDKDLLEKVTISGCSKGCTKITAITLGLSKLYELTGGAIPVLKNLQATTDKACTVTWKGFEFDVDQAATYVTDNAESGYKGWCARYVQNALRDAGLYGMPGANAKDMGPVLEDYGFEDLGSGTVTGDNSVASPQKGDVVVFDAVPGHSNGHVAIWNGSSWVSDTVQPHFSANQRDYRGGTYHVYRSKYYQKGHQAYAHPE